jgi:Leucine-rich repeat (LRR) protein
MPTPPKRKRRWFQYSIRSLLLLTTVLAVWLAVQVNRAHRQKLAVSTIMHAGGKIAYDHEMLTREHPQPTEPPGPLWLRRILGDEYFLRPAAVECTDVDSEIVEQLGNCPTLRYVTLSGGTIVDEDLSHIARLADLEQLRLEDVAITDAGLKHLFSLKKLKTLALNHTNVTGAGLEQLKWMELDWFHLNGSPVTDAGLSQIANLKRVGALDLSDTQVTSAGLEHLIRLNGLRGLWLNNTQADDEGLKQLGALRQLQTLHLEGTQITDAGLSHLKGLPNLIYFEVGGTNVSQAALQEFEKGLAGPRRIMPAAANPNPPTNESIEAPQTRP